MKYIDYLKKEYNKHIEANKKAEEYFKTHKPSECMKWITRFNEITKELSRLMIVLERTLGRELTDHERFNGFTEMR